VFESWAPYLNGTPAQVTIGPKRARRSLEQNALLHALIGQLATWLGYGPGELKDVLKELYGPKRLAHLGDRKAMVPLSTAYYTKQQMSDMIEHIYRLAAEYGCTLEEPTEC